MFGLKGSQHRRDGVPGGQKCCVWIRGCAFEASGLYLERTGSLGPEDWSRIYLGLGCRHVSLGLTPSLLLHGPCCGLLKSEVCIFWECSCELPASLPGRGWQPAADVSEWLVKPTVRVPGLTHACWQALHGRLCSRVQMDRRGSWQGLLRSGPGLSLYGQRNWPKKGR